MNFIQFFQPFSITNKEYKILRTEYKIIEYKNKRNKIQDAENAKRNKINYID